MEIHGVEVVEKREQYGYSWRWHDARGFESEILWMPEVGRLELGTRVHPGAWTHYGLDPDEWGVVRTMDEARQAVERYVSRVTVGP